jgi:CBS domain-containing protein
VEEAIEHMETRQIRRLVVCEKDRIVGVVSLGDLAETVSDQAEAVLVEVSKSERTLAHKR